MLHLKPIQFVAKISNIISCLIYVAKNIRQLIRNRSSECIKVFNSRFIQDLRTNRLQTQPAVYYKFPCATPCLIYLRQTISCSTQLQPTAQRNCYELLKAYEVLCVFWRILRSIRAVNFSNYAGPVAARSEA